MFLLGLILAIIGCVFAFRWFSEHKFEYLEGVKPSEQLDRNFWLCMTIIPIAIVLMIVGSL